MNKKHYKNPLVIFLTGPTAVGKTQLSIELNKYLPINIISVDSGLVYKTLDIGTGKPTKNELLQVPHQLINIKDPTENYSAGEFKKDSLKAIQNSINDNRIPILVGGTMLYFKVLLDGLALLPVSNITLRKKLIKESRSVGSTAIHKKLSLIDPIAANRIHPNDLQRIIRALEVYLISGKTLTELISTTKVDFPYTVLTLVLLPDSNIYLNKKIELRFNNMLDKGFQYEVENLLNRGDLNINLNAIRRIGYVQMWKFLLNDLSYNQMIQQSLSATRQLAKHQMTWLKKWTNAHYINYSNVTQCVHHILMLLKKHCNLF
ncbi:MAG TPA: tRNA (adenosine(37)-N6)-dimethylallyltransferase MiaA [Buchnera sp. (in: enterobacteria)]|nr:tRNA (adenosine(37)-N6)-dimethylallyltransferase MiaA [Buchnera sp. (in: enterobacteria)]